MTTQGTSPKDRSARVLTYGFLLLFLVYSMFPLGWMLATSFKPEEQTKEYPPRLIPKTVTLENYHRVLTQTMMPRFVFNSLTLSGGTMVAVLGLAGSKVLTSPKSTRNTWPSGVTRMLAGFTSR